MATCSHCGVETALYKGGAPICVKCSNLWEAKREPPLNTDQIRTALVSQIAEATAQVSDANNKFSEAIGKFPGGFPHGDGLQQINSASNELNLARKKMMTAHQRLNDFVERGIVPDDLKRSG